MTNIAKLNTNKVMKQIIKAAPIGILVCALLSFIAIAIFSTDYYETLFTGRFGPNQAFWMAICIALIQEAVRFCLLITSIRDFSRQEKSWVGWGGLVFSLYLVYHDIKIANEIALLWSPDSPTPFYNIFLFLILVGFILEIRLILTVDVSDEAQTNTSNQNQSANNGAEKEGEKDRAGKRESYSPTPSDPLYPVHLNGSQNGNGLRIADIVGDH